MFTPRALKKYDDYAQTDAKKFVIIGLPRSGTTYLSTLLNSHPHIKCSGEEFNPYAVIDDRRKDDSHAAVLARDQDPKSHLNKLLIGRLPPEVSHLGLKFMLGHNLAVLTALSRIEDLKIIYLFRKNRLAQAASMYRAEECRVWASTENSTSSGKISATPRDISRRWHEFATQDFLFEKWLSKLPHQKFIAEYTSLFELGFDQRVCNFLGVEPGHSIKSPLRRQGPANVLDRFRDPKPIKYYFRQIGYGHWLEPEF